MKELLAAVTVLALSTAQADTIYVDVNCPGPGDGSIGEPYCSIQTAIDNAVDADEIVVAAGIYLEAIDFMGKAVALRSSDGPKVTIIDGTGNFHVVQCVSDEGPDTILDGFTITGGNADDNGFPDDRGGGMYNSDSSPTVTNCTFSGNSADHGGGMHNSSSFNGGVSTPTVTNCTFSGNSADLSGGGMTNVNSSPTVTGSTFEGNTVIQLGGGMFNFESSPTVTNCTFSGNSAWTGGGMFNSSDSDSSPTVTNSTFIGNSATTGGGMFNVNYSSPTVTNCTFSGNSANRGGGMANKGSDPTVMNCSFIGNSTQPGPLDPAGGGMANYFHSSPTVTNCTFSGNATGGLGGGMYSGGISSPTLTNCVLWADSPDEFSFSGFGTSIITHSDVQGGWPGLGNIDADPQFVDPDNGDFRLSPGSPCIDAGDNTAVPGEITTDLDGNLRFVDDPDTADTGNGVCAVDIGAYEFQEGAVVCCPGDINGDGVVNVLDLIELLPCFGQPSTPPCDTGQDVIGDGTVNVLDLIQLLLAFGTICP